MDCYFNKRTMNANFGFGPGWTYCRTRTMRTSRLSVHIERGQEYIEIMNVECPGQRASVLECGGKQSATPLWNAVRFPNRNSCTVSSDREHRREGILRAGWGSAACLTDHRSPNRSVRYVRSVQSNSQVSPQAIAAQRCSTVQHPARLQSSSRRQPPIH